MDRIPGTRPAATPPTGEPGETDTSAHQQYESWIGIEEVEAILRDLDPENFPAAEGVPDSLVLGQRDVTIAEPHTVSSRSLTMPGTSSGLTHTIPAIRPDLWQSSDSVSEEEPETELLVQPGSGSSKQSSPATTESGSFSFDTSRDRKARTIFCEV
ncbi:hypothetical protein, partial [Kistimonas scapharcae]|uniref:hypothetical protein n=1 Tax=Kistimonas scapharcae TaxID=1036133 RepID=UPI0031ED0AFC